MRRRIRKLLAVIIIAAISGSGLLSLNSCGTLRSHWGVEHEYEYEFEDGGRHHKRPKPPKPPKKKKHKKHKKHHHHDD